MSASDWDQRYAGRDFVWSVEPNRLLADEVGRLRPGRALDRARRATRRTARRVELTGRS